MTSFLLGCTLAIAILLRFIGTNPGYPPIHSDEAWSYSQATHMILEGTLDPKHGVSEPHAYGILMPLINAVFYLIIFIPFSFLSHFKEVLSLIKLNGFTHFIYVDIYDIFNNLILGPEKVNTIYWSRYTTALFGVGTVYLTYLLSKKLFQNKNIALISSWLVAINYRLVLNSHFGLPDIYNAFFLLLSLTLTVNLLNNPKNLRNYFAASLGAALSFSVKLQFFSFLPLVYVTLLLWKRNHFKISFRFLIIPIASLFFLFLLNMPHIMNWKKTIATLQYASLKYRFGRNQFDFFPYSYLYHVGIGKITSILSLIGLVLTFFYKPFASFIIILVMFPFLLFITYITGGGIYTRNLVTVIPLILTFCAFFLDKINSRLLRLVFLAVISWESLQNSIQVPLEYQNPWNRNLVSQFIDSNITSSSLLAVNKFSSISLKNKNISLLDNNPKDLTIASLQNKKVNYLILDIHLLGEYFYWWMSGSTKDSLRFWNMPVKVLENSPSNKVVGELKNHLVFEELNKWQAPDENYLVVKVPPKTDLMPVNLVYEENFNTQNWRKENDGYGDLSNLSRDDNFGRSNNGSLKINGSGNSYSQRFTSPEIKVNKQLAYRLTGYAYTKYPENTSYFYVDYYSSNNKYLGSSFAGPTETPNEWFRRDVNLIPPEGTSYIKIVFQSEFDNTCWLDDVELWEATGEAQEKYINSKFDPMLYFFSRSHSGM